MADKKKVLEVLKEMVWKTYELEETIKNFGPETQPVLDERMFQFIEGIRELVPMGNSFKDVKIPVDLLQYVDLGGNPHQYTAEIFKACTRDNQISKGKAEAVQSLYDAVLNEMQATQPEAAQQYMSLVAATKRTQASDAT